MHNPSVKRSITIEVESTAGKGTAFNGRILLAVAEVAAHARRKIDHRIAGQLRKARVPRLDIAMEHLAQ